jgi:nitrile hydratase subunit alpha
MNGAEETVGYYRRMQAAVEELLILKGIVSREDIDREVVEMDARDNRRGARMVARAWVDPGYKARLLENGREAAEELGLAVGPMHLIIIENTPTTHNVIVCTLCSCYPRMLLGMPPAWYKSSQYRARVVHEPRQVLSEFGLVIPRDMNIRVHDSSADMRYMVLPMRPSGTDGWNEESLAELVSRECLVGTAVPQLPPAA